MTQDRTTPIQVVLPAHNEGESIGETLTEFFTVAHDQDGLDVSFVVSEDGSKDNTVAVVEALAETLPILLLSAIERKGYSRAVVDAFRETTAPLVAFIDSDGQCDPSDLKRLVDTLDASSDLDLVTGYRNPRKDAWYRLVFSGAFGLVYKALFPVRLKDPSCPYILIKRSALDQLLSNDEKTQLGILRQGFWWEFNARVNSLGLKFVQVPVNHRVRTAGTTQVYKWGKIPGIAVEHLKALFALRAELRRN